MVNGGPMRDSGKSPKAEYNTSAKTTAARTSTKMVSTKGTTGARVQQKTTGRAAIAASRVNDLKNKYVASTNGRARQMSRPAALTNAIRTAKGQ